MKLIKPRNISGELMTLIEEADEKLIIVSPYYNVGQWTKFKNCIKSLQSKKIATEFYVRAGEQKSIADVQALGYQPLSIERLHTKLYMNEKHAIISSMNLNESSDSGSLDIALITETEDEYRKVFDYYDRYIKQSANTNTIQQKTNSPAVTKLSKSVHRNWKEALDERLEQALGRDVSIRSHGNDIQVQTANLYTVTISNTFSSDLEMTGVLTAKEHDYAKAHSFFKSEGMAVFLQKGDYDRYNMACGRKSLSKSKSIHRLQEADEDVVVDALYRFIIQVEDLKKVVKTASKNDGEVKAASKNLNASHKNEPDFEMMYRKICGLFPNDKITRTKEYIYFTKVMVGVDAFIKTDGICLKYTLSKDRTSSEAKQLLQSIQSRLGDTEVLEDEPGYWDIHMKDCSTTDVEKIIGRLRQSAHRAKSFLGVR